MRGKTIPAIWAAILFLAVAGPARAHFGMVIPSTNIATAEKKTVDLTLSFSHPFELKGMDLSRPDKFFVIKDGRRTDLLDTLQPTRIMEHEAWKTSYRFKRPGVYSFVMVPHPYWEPAEDLSIIHYTRTIVAVFGADEGWDQPLGLPTEIVPLLRPFGNYAGNTFTGRVLLQGKSVPGAEVEVEYYNRDGSLVAPTEYHVTQLVKADDEGVFSFTCPRAGWWGFAALNEADYTLKNPAAEEKPVELGGVLWIYFNDYQTNPHNPRAQ